MKKLAQLRVNSSCLPVIESTKDQWMDALLSILRYYCVRRLPFLVSHEVEHAEEAHRR